MRNPTPCALIAEGFLLMQPKYLCFTNEKTVCVQPHVIVKGVKNRMLKEHSGIQSNHVHVASACSLAIFVCLVWVLEIGATTRLKNYVIQVHVCVYSVRVCVFVYVCAHACTYVTKDVITEHLLHSLLSRVHMLDSHVYMPIRTCFVC